MTSHSKTDEADNICPICFDSFEEANTTENNLTSDCEIGQKSKKPWQNPNCGHEFCQPCLKEYLEFSISSQKYPLSCPEGGKEGCTSVLQERDVAKTLTLSDGSDEEGITLAVEGSIYWRTFKRLQSLYNDPSLVACPKCDALVGKSEEQPPQAEISKRKKDTDLNERHCQSCQHSFCVIHGDSHPQISCQRYLESKKGKHFRRSERTMQRWTKPCSHCGARLFKAEGCDHVVCPNCQGDMCYRCGTHHYLTGKVTRSCSRCKQSFLDHRYETQYRRRICLLLPFALPSIIIYTIIVGLGAILSLLFGCCFGCGYYVNDPDQDEGRHLAPLRGILLGLKVVFLPLLSVFEDFGIDCGIRNGLLATSNGDTILEIPTMSITDDDEDCDAERCDLSSV